MARIARIILWSAVLLGRTAARVGLVCALVTTPVVVWISRDILPDLPVDLSELRDWRPLTSCQVYAADGTPVDEFYVERRIWVPIEDLDPLTWRAFVAAEDRRFLEHPGVDWVGILRAVVANVQAGHIAQGGSTITQQLVKNVVVGNERSLERKVREAILSVRLDRQLTKMEILELYVNYVFLGSGNYGVEAAARDYFGIPARDLDPGQAALLAGLVPAPSRYSPRLHPEQAANRRSIVLQILVEEGMVSEEDANRWRAEPVLAPREERQEANPNAAYLTRVRREVRRLLGSDFPFEAGLQVHTALDPAIQAVAVDAVQEAVRDLERRQGRRVPVLQLPPEAWARFLARADGLPRHPGSHDPLPPDPGMCFPALVGTTGGLEALQAGPWMFRLHEEDARTRVRTAEGPPRPLASVVTPGDVLRVCRGEEDAVRLDPRPWGEGAAVVVENATGRVVALVGGYDATLEGYVRATQARRQPGSSFKPYVYAAALLGGRSQLDLVRDAPIALPAGGGRTWSPRNYGGGYEGTVLLRTALSRSLNTVAVRLILEQGPERVARLARAMGVGTPLRTDPTIALGSSEVTPLDQALGYATIARLGVPAEPVLIDRLVDVRGWELARAGDPVVVDGEERVKLPGAPRPAVLPPGVAYELLDMMREVVRRGTARKAWKPGYDRAGKTGTTNGFQDAWFVGFTPRYTVSVWIGTDGTATLGDKETGGRAALPAWLRIVEALPQPEGERFPVPDDAIQVGTPAGWVGLRRGTVPRSVLALPELGDAPLPLPSSPREVPAAGEAPLLE